MNGDECWAGMNPPTGQKLNDSQCNAECVISTAEKKIEEKDVQYNCGGEEKVSVYRVTVPDREPNDGALLILDDTTCKTFEKLENSKHLWNCANQVRENTANGGNCFSGGGYFNWEA